MANSIIRDIVANENDGCNVCFDKESWEDNPVVICEGKGCSVEVHQACYGIKSLPPGKWYCSRCENKKTYIKCKLCPSREGAFKKTDNKGWAHVVCALYIPEVSFGNVTTMEPIVLKDIPPRRYKNACYICKDQQKSHTFQTGACMDCNKMGCKQKFHVTCAQALGLLCEEPTAQLDVNYCGYCKLHYSELSEMRRPSSKKVHKKKVEKSKTDIIEKVKNAGKVENKSDEKNIKQSDEGSSTKSSEIVKARSVEKGNTKNFDLVKNKSHEKKNNQENVARENTSSVAIVVTRIVEKGKATNVGVIGNKSPKKINTGSLEKDSNKGIAEVGSDEGVKTKSPELTINKIVGKNNTRAENGNTRRVETESIQTTEKVSGISVELLSNNNGEKISAEKVNTTNIEELDVNFKTGSAKFHSNKSVGQAIIGSLKEINARSPEQVSSKSSEGINAKSYEGVKTKSSELPINEIVGKSNTRAENLNPERVVRKNIKTAGKISSVELLRNKSGEKVNSVEAAKTGSVEFHSNKSVGEAMAGSVKEKNARSPGKVSSKSSEDKNSESGKNITTGKKIEKTDVIRGIRTLGAAFTEVIFSAAFEAIDWKNYSVELLEEGAKRTEVALAGFTAVISNRKKVSKIGLDGKRKREKLLKNHCGLRRKLFESSSEESNVRANANGKFLQDKENESSSAKQNLENVVGPQHESLCGKRQLETGSDDNEEHSGEEPPSLKKVKISKKKCEEQLESRTVSNQSVGKASTDNSNNDKKEHSINISGSTTVVTVDNKVHEQHDSSSVSNQSIENALTNNGKGEEEESINIFGSKKVVTADNKGSKKVLTPDEKSTTRSSSGEGDFGCSTSPNNVSLRGKRQRDTDDSVELFTNSPLPEKALLCPKKVKRIDNDIGSSAKSSSATTTSVESSGESTDSANIEGNCSTSEKPSNVKVVIIPDHDYAKVSLSCTKNSLALPKVSQNMAKWENTSSDSGCVGQCSQESVELNDEDLFKTDLLKNMVAMMSSEERLKVKNTGLDSTLIEEKLKRTKLV